MRFESIELKGYIGLYQGTLKTDIKINFGKNRINESLRCYNIITK